MQRFHAWLGLVAWALLLASASADGPAWDIKTLQQKVCAEYPQLTDPELDDYTRVTLLRQWAWSHTCRSYGSTKTLDNDPAIDWWQLDAPAIFQLFDENRGGVICGGTALALQRLYEAFGHVAWTVNYGDAKTGATHVTTLVMTRFSDRKIICFQDAYFNTTLVDAKSGEPVDYFDLVSRLVRREHQSVRRLETDYRKVPSLPAMIVFDEELGGAKLHDIVDSSFSLLTDNYTVEKLPNKSWKLTSPRTFSEFSRQIQRGSNSGLASYSTWLETHGYPIDIIYLHLYPLGYSGPETDAMLKLAKLVAAGESLESLVEFPPMPLPPEDASPPEIREPLKSYLQPASSEKPPQDPAPPVISEQPQTDAPVVTSEQPLADKSLVAAVTAKQPEASTPQATSEQPEQPETSKQPVTPVTAEKPQADKPAVASSSPWADWVLWCGVVEVIFALHMFRRMRSLARPAKVATPGLFARMAAAFKSADMATIVPADVQQRSRFLAVDSILIFGLSTAVFLSLYAYFDNTNINTTNGLWKSIHVREWAENSPKKFIQNPNVLLFPVNGLLARLMPDWTGPIYRRMAILNCFYGGLGVAAVFALLRGLGINRRAATCGALFQAGCAFYLICAVTSEDIMPAVAFLTLACAMVAWTWDRPSYWGVFLAAQPFSMAWLFEWRLLLPSLPGFVVALALAPSTVTLRIRRSCWFVVSALFLPLLCAIGIKLGGASNSVPTILRNFIFVDKGQGTGWGGWAWNKFTLLYIGLQEYLVGGKNIQDVDYFFSSTPAFVQIISWIVLLGLMACGLWFSRRHWQEANWRSVAVVLVGIFGCAEVFNLYSQPHDPQMQMNAMLWVAVAWGMLMYVVLNLAQNRRKLATTVCLTLSLCPLVINTWYQLPVRGEDSKNEAAIAKLSEIAPPDHTLLIMHGFEGFSTWIAALKGWDLYQTPPLKSSDEPWKTWKVLGLVNEAIHFPQHSATDSADVIKQQIDSALDQGVRVVMNSNWGYDEDRFSAQWAAVSKAEKPQEIYRMLKREYEAQEIVGWDPLVPSSPLYELRRKDVKVAQQPAKDSGTQ